MQSPGDLPAAEVAGRGIAPDMGGECRTGLGDLVRHFDDHARLDAGFLGGELRRVLAIDFFEHSDEAGKIMRLVGILFAQIIFPVDPAAQKFAVEEILLQ